MTVDEIPFIFKFKSPGIEGRVHRITLKASDGIIKLRELMNEKLRQRFRLLNVPKPDGNASAQETYAISYVDDEEMWYQLLLIAI